MRFRDQDQLLIHSVTLAAATMIMHATNILFQMVMMRRLPASEYGAMAAMLSLVVIVATPLEAVRTVTAHFVAILCRDGQRMSVLGVVQRWSLHIVFVAVLFLVVGLMFRSPLAAFFRLDSSLVIVVVFIGIAILFFTPLFAGSLQGMQAFRALAAMWIFWGLARLGTGAALVYIVDATALAALIGQGVGAVVCVAAGWIGLTRALRGGMTDGGLAGPDCYREGYGSAGGIRYLIGSLCVLAAYSTLMTADVAMVKHLFAPEDAGVFARAATIGRSIIFLPMPIAFALFPKVAANGVASCRDRANLWRAVRYTIYLVGAAGLAAFLLAPFCWYVFAGAWPDARSLSLVRFAITAMAPLGLTFVMINFELAQRRFRAIFVLLPLALAYIAGVCLWHDTLWHVFAVMGVMNIASALLIALGIARREVEVASLKCRSQV